MALPYITGRQGQVLSTEVVEKMAAEGKIGTGSGSGFEKITSANDLLTIPSEETMGKIYQYEGKDYLINVTEKSEELSVDVDPDIFYNKVQVKDKDFKFEFTEDTWKLNQVKQFDLVELSDDVNTFSYYCSDTVSFGIEPDKNYTVLVNYKGHQVPVPMGPNENSETAIRIEGERQGENYITSIEGTYYLDNSHEYMLAIVGYDGVHVEDISKPEQTSPGGTFLVVGLVLNDDFNNLIYPTLGEEIDILDENGNSILKSMQEVDLSEYGITVKGTKQNSNFIVRSNSVMYNKYELYQVTADSKNLPGTPIEVDSDNLKIYINNEIDITKYINTFGGVPQGSEFYVVSYDLLTTTNGENSNFTVVVKDGEKWKEFLNMKDVPEAAKKEITFKCVYDEIEGTEEQLEAGLKLLYADNDLLFINNSDSSVKQNYMNILTEAIEVRDLEENVFDWNQSRDFQSNIIKGGDNFTIKIDDKGNVTAVVNPRIKESITYILCLLHPESPDSYWEGIAYNKLPIRNDAIAYLPEYPNLGNLIYASKLIVDAMAEEGIIIKTNSNGFTENLEGITLDGSKISHIYNGTEENISNELFSSTPFEKSLTNFRLTKMYDKLPEGVEEGKFLTVDAKGNYIWKKVEGVIWVEDIIDLNVDQLLKLVTNPDIVVAKQGVHGCTNDPDFYQGSIDYYSFAGFNWDNLAHSHYATAYYVCYSGYSKNSGNATAKRKIFTFNAYLGSTFKFEKADRESLREDSDSDVIIDICRSQEYPWPTSNDPRILVQTGNSVENIGWMKPGLLTDALKQYLTNETFARSLQGYFNYESLANALKQYLTNEAFATELQKHLNIQTLFTALEPSLNDWYAKKQQPTEGPTQ